MEYHIQPQSMCSDALLILMEEQVKHISTHGTKDVPAGQGIPFKKIKEVNNQELPQKCLATMKSCGKMCCLVHMWPAGGWMNELTPR